MRASTCSHSSARSARTARTSRRARCWLYRRKTNAISWASSSRVNGCWTGSPASATSIPICRGRTIRFRLHLSRAGRSRRLQRRLAPPDGRGRRALVVERARGRPGISRRRGDRNHRRPPAAFGAVDHRRRRPLRAEYTRIDLKSEDPEFSQIGVAVFFKSFDGTPLNTWDRHLYGARGAIISGSRIRPGLYRYILEADLAEKQTDRLGAIQVYESVARQHDPWLYERVMREPRVGRQWSMAPLGYRVSAVARDRLLLVGDAAGYLSPITGQGNEFALRTGRLAAAAAAEALHGGDLSAASLRIVRRRPPLRGRAAS